MYDKEFARLIKIAVETLKEETIYQMVQQSVEYQKEKDLSGLAEERYLELDLPIVISITQGFTSIPKARS